jgi:DNA-binding transcriptional regulator YhcF (GntR family)
MPKGQGVRGNISDKVDRHLLHEYMWKHSDRNGCFQMTQTALANGLGVNLQTMSTIFRELVSAGRIRKVGARFHVADPEKWRWENPTPAVPQRLWNL